LSILNKDIMKHNVHYLMLTMILAALEIKPYFLDLTDILIFPVQFIRANSSIKIKILFTFIYTFLILSWT
jgi:hypothetical protein